MTTTAPERIWTTGSADTGSWNRTPVGQRGLVEVPYIRADLASAAGHPAPAPPATVALVEAAEALMAALTAEDQFHDRALNISGGTTAIRDLIDAEDEMNAALTAARAWRAGQPVADVAGAVDWRAVACAVAVNMEAHAALSTTTAAKAADIEATIRSALSEDGK